MIIHRKGCIASSLILIIIIAAVTGCSDSKNSKTGSAAKEEIPVTAVTVKDQLVSPLLRFSGTVEAWTKAALGSEIPGRIVAMNCDVGDLVRKDSLLVELGSETLIQARSNYDAVKKDWERIRTLRESGTVSQQTYDQTQAAFEAAKAGYEKTLASTHVRAPFTGIVTQKYLDVGEVFTLMPGQAGSPAILELMQTDTVKVTVAVAENLYHEIALGQQATLTLDASPDAKFIGSVSKIAPTVSTKTRTASVDIQYGNYRGTLKPGMFGIVNLSLPLRHALLVNRDVLIKQEGTGVFYAFKIQADTVTRVNVTKGEDFVNLVEITSGLQPGDTVVNTGKMKVSSGSRVRVASVEVTQ